VIRVPLKCLFGQNNELLLAEKLFNLGARPPVVSAICNIGNKAAIRLYKILFVCSPRQGLLPYDPFWIVRSSVHNCHASIFLGLIHDLTEQQSESSAVVFITAYELYCQIVATNSTPCKREASVPNGILLDINRAWHLTGQLNSREMSLLHCPQCNARYVAISNTPLVFQQCPICDVWSDKIGRRRWMTVRSRKKSITW
jgi:hypothetical protein